MSEKVSPSRAATASNSLILSAGYRKDFANRCFRCGLFTVGVCFMIREKPLFTRYAAQARSCPTSNVYGGHVPVKRNIAVRAKHKELDLGTVGGRIGHALMETVGPNKQTWLAGEVSELDHTAVSKWISNTTPPKPEHLTGIVEVLGISGHWLLTGEGTMHHAPELAVVTLGDIEKRIGRYKRAAKKATEDAKTRADAAAKEALARRGKKGKRRVPKGADTRTNRPTG